MATFLMFGKYSTEGVKGASPARTKEIIDLIRQCGGKVQSMYALMGDRDLAFFVDFAGTEQAMRASFELARATGISFSSQAALPVADFDRLIAGEMGTARASARQTTLRARRVT